MTHNALGCIAAALFLAFGAVAVGGAVYFALSALSPLLLVAAGAGLLLLLGVGLWAWFKLRPKQQQPQGLGTIVVHVANTNNASVGNSGNSNVTWR